MVEISSSEDVSEMELHRAFGKEVSAGSDVDRLGMVLGGLPPGHVQIASVIDESWAERAGIVAGDWLVEVNGEDLTNMTAESFKASLRSRPFSAVLEPFNPEAVQSQKPGSSGLLSAPLDSRSAPHSANSTFLPKMEEAPMCKVIRADAAVEKLGITPHGLPPGYLEVIAVREGSWAENVGVEVGEVIIEVNSVDLLAMTAESFKQHLQSRPLEMVLEPPFESSIEETVDTDWTSNGSSAGPSFSRRRSDRFSLASRSDDAAGIADTPVASLHGKRHSGHQPVGENIRHDMQVMMKELDASKDSVKFLQKKLLQQEQHSQAVMQNTKTEIEELSTVQAAQAADAARERQRTAEMTELLAELRTAAARQASSDSSSDVGGRKAAEVSRLQALLRAEEATVRAMRRHSPLELAGDKDKNKQDKHEEAMAEISNLRTLVKAEESALRGLRREQARYRAEEKEKEAKDKAPEGLSELEQQLEAEKSRQRGLQAHLERTLEQRDELQADARMRNEERQLMEAQLKDLMQKMATMEQGNGAPREDLDHARRLAVKQRDDADAELAAVLKTGKMVSAELAQEQQLAFQLRHHRDELGVQLEAMQSELTKRHPQHMRTFSSGSAAADKHVQDAETQHSVREVSTTLVAVVVAGATSLAALSSVGFSLGDTISIGGSEIRRIMALTPFTLERPLERSYPPGSEVRRVPPRPDLEDLVSKQRANLYEEISRNKQLELQLQQAVDVTSQSPSPAKPTLVDFQYHGQIYGVDPITAVVHDPISKAELGIVEETVVVFYHSTYALRRQELMRSPCLPEGERRVQRIVLPKEARVHGTARTPGSALLGTYTQPPPRRQSKDILADDLSKSRTASISSVLALATDSDDEDEAEVEDHDYFGEHVLLDLVRNTVYASDPPHVVLGKLLGGVLFCYDDVVATSIGVPKLSLRMSRPITSGDVKALLVECCGRQLLLDPLRRRVHDRTPPHAHIGDLLRGEICFFHRACRIEEPSESDVGTLEALRVEYGGAWYLLDEKSQDLYRDVDDEVEELGSPIGRLVDGVPTFFAIAHEVQPTELVKSGRTYKSASSSEVGQGVMTSTLTTAPVMMGSREVPVLSVHGFCLGDVVWIGHEMRRIVAFASIVLDRPLESNHPAGTEVRLAHRAGGASEQADGTHAPLLRELAERDEVIRRLVEQMAQDGNGVQLPYQVTSAAAEAQDDLFKSIEKAVAQRDEETLAASQLRAVLIQQQATLRSECFDLEANNLLQRRELEMLREAHKEEMLRELAQTDLTTMMEVASMHGNLVSALSAGRATEQSMEVSMVSLERQMFEERRAADEELHNWKEEVKALQARLHARGHPSQSLMKRFTDPHDELAAEEVAEASAARACRLALAKRENMCASLLVSNQHLDARISAMEAKATAQARELEALEQERGIALEMQLERDRAAEAAVVEAALELREAAEVTALRGAVAAGFEEIQHSHGQVGISEATTQYEIYEVEELKRVLHSEDAAAWKRQQEVTVLHSQELQRLDRELLDSKDALKRSMHEVVMQEAAFLSEQSALLQLQQQKGLEAAQTHEIAETSSRRALELEELQAVNSDLPCTGRRLIEAVRDQQASHDAHMRRQAHLEEAAAQWCLQAERNHALASDVASKAAGLQAGAEESALLLQKLENVSEEANRLRHHIETQGHAGDAALRYEEKVARQAAEAATRAQQVEAEVLRTALAEVREQAYQRATAAKQAEQASYSAQLSERRADEQEKQSRAMLLEEAPGWDRTPLDSLLDSARNVLAGVPDVESTTLDSLMLQTSIRGVPGPAPVGRESANISRTPTGASQASTLREQAERLRSQVQHWNVARSSRQPRP